MPLMKGSSKKIIWRNFKEMMAAGHPEAQSWAAAYSYAGKSRKKKKKKRTRKKK